MKKAILQTKLKNNTVKCTACSWYCVIPEGQTGICAVRQNRGGELYLLVYGLTTGLQIDPIEKKPFYHFLPGEPVLSFGTIGCNFACDFCLNWQSSQASKVLKDNLSQEDDLENLGAEITKYGYAYSPEEIVNYAEREGYRIIAYTYNEPAVFFEYALDTAKLAKEKGIKNVYVSNGFESREATRKIAPLLDGINIDLKAFNPNFYQRLCHAKIEPVLENIKRFHEEGVWLEITTLVIPGENDSEPEFNQIAKFIAGIDANIPWHISRFRPDYKLINKSPTPLETLIKAGKIGRKAGLNYVYLGNISAPGWENTLCPNCRATLIERVNYQTKIINLDKGVCRLCQEKIAGVWE